MQKSVCARARARATLELERLALSLARDARAARADQAF